MIVDVTGLKFYTHQRTRATTAGAKNMKDKNGKVEREDKTETPKKLMPKVNPNITFFSERNLVT